MTCMEIVWGEERRCRRRGGEGENEGEKWRREGERGVRNYQADQRGGVEHDV